MNDYLNWRYATKQFDPLKKISMTEFDELLEVLRLSPSSFGLQPWKFVVVQDQVLRKEIRKHAWDQAQVTDASHLIILCSLKTMDEAYIKNCVHDIARVRSLPMDSLAGYEQMMVSIVKTKSQDELSNWMKRQVYIALGMLLSACAQKRIDSCPMEGFNPKKVDEILGLDKQAIESVVLCPVGYRSQEDQYASLKKVRFQKNEILIEK